MQAGKNATILNKVSACRDVVFHRMLQVVCTYRHNTQTHTHMICTCRYFTYISLTVFARASGVKQSTGFAPKAAIESCTEMVSR